MKKEFKFSLPKILMSSIFYGLVVALALAFLTRLLKIDSEILSFLLLPGFICGFLFQLVSKLNYTIVVDNKSVWIKKWNVKKEEFMYENFTFKPYTRTKIYIIPITSRYLGITSSTTSKVISCYMGKEMFGDMCSALLQNTQSFHSTKFDEKKK